MGNIVSNMSAVNTRIGLIVSLKIVTGPDGRKELLKPEYTFTWCTRPGTLTDSYATIAVEDFNGRRELWKNPSDYDNMVSSYRRVKEATGIED